jgi:adenylate cyclase
MARQGFKNLFKNPLSRLWRVSLGLSLWLAPIALGLALCFANPTAVDNLRNLIFDQYQRISPRAWTPDLPVRVIDIDDASLEKIGQWPWPRKRLAELAQKLNELGAAAVVFDILFAEKDRLTPENMLAELPDIPERNAFREALVAKGLINADSLSETLAKMPSVLAFVLTFEGTPRDIPIKAGFASAGDDPIPYLQHFHKAILPLPHLTERVAGLGAINWIPDRDLIVRKAPLLLSVDGTDSTPLIVPSLDAEALRVAQGASTIIVKSSNASGAEAFGASTGIISVKIGDAEIDTESDGMVRIHFAGTQAARHISAWRVLNGDVSADDVNGKIALIGSSAAAQGDLRSTPLEAAVPGVDIHAELIEHIASGAHLARPDYALGLEAILLLTGGLVTALFVRFANPIASAFWTACLICGFAVGSFEAFLRADLLFDPLMPSATSLAVYTVMTVAVYRRSERQRRFVRQAFGRYLAPALVEQLAEDPSRLQLGGEARDVTVLFSDIRGFTARAETLSAQEVVQFLNSLHTPLTEIVLRESGTLDKYIGDGLMAFWNAPTDTKNHADHACRAALAMCKKVKTIDAQVAASMSASGRAHLPIDIGVGISSGEVFVGNIGSEHRFDYSIVGDTVNVAARLESATKTLGIQIVVSEATVRAATNFCFLPLGKVDLKGKSQRFDAFTLHGPVSEATEDFKTFAALHEAVVDAVKQRDAGGEADVEAAVEAAKVHPLGDAYAKFYERCLNGFG